MAKEQITRLVDDLDGQSDAVRTVGFHSDGRDYEIDLTEEHATQLEELKERQKKQLAKYVHAGRYAGGPDRNLARKRSPRKSTRGMSVYTKRAYAKSVREWAAQQKGSELPSVGNRGRIPMQVVAAYEAAHSGASGGTLTATKERSPKA